MDQKEIPMGALTPAQTRAVLAVEIHLRHEYILKSNAHDRDILSPPLMKILLRLYTLRGRGFPSPRAVEGRGGGCIFTVKEVLRILTNEDFYAKPIQSGIIARYKTDTGQAEQNGPGARPAIF